MAERNGSPTGRGVQSSVAAGLRGIESVLARMLETSPGGLEDSSPWNVVDALASIGRAGDKIAKAIRAAHEHPIDLSIGRPIKEVAAAITEAGADVRDGLTDVSVAIGDAGRELKRIADEIADLGDRR